MWEKNIQYIVISCCKNNVIVMCYCPQVKAHHGVCCFIYSFCNFIYRKFISKHVFSDFSAILWLCILAEYFLAVGSRHVGPGLTGISGLRTGPRALGWLQT